MAQPRALISVHDKTGLEPFAKALSDLGWEIVASGGTAAAIAAAGVDVRQIDDVTGSPEVLDGRVKTLHPAIHAGILARRDAPDHLRQLDSLDIGTIDLVAVNLYPFAATLAATTDRDEIIEACQFLHCVGQPIAAIVETKLSKARRHQETCLDEN